MGGAVPASRTKVEVRQEVGCSEAWIVVSLSGGGRAGHVGGGTCDGAEGSNDDGAYPRGSDYFDNCSNNDCYYEFPKLP